MSYFPPSPYPPVDSIPSLRYTSCRPTSYMTVQSSELATRPLLQTSVEHDSSLVEHHTLNRGSLGSNPLCNCFGASAFLFPPQGPSSLSCIDEYLATVSGGNKYLRSNYSMAEWFKERSSWCRIEQYAKAWSIRCSDRSDGLDAALYKNTPLPSYLCVWHVICCFLKWRRWGVGVLVAAVETRTVATCSDRVLQTRAALLPCTSTTLWRCRTKRLPTWICLGECQRCGAVYCLVKLVLLVYPFYSISIP